jgi:hypothetical protein
MRGPLPDRSVPPAVGVLELVLEDPRFDGPGVDEEVRIEDP